MSIVDKLLQEQAYKTAAVDEIDFWAAEPSNYALSEVYNQGFEDGVIMLARIILREQGRSSLPVTGTNKIYLGDVPMA